MKRLIAAVVMVFSLVLAFTGCAHTQQPTSPPALSCPVPNQTAQNYTEANPPTSVTVSASITATNFNFTPPSTGNWCITVQAWAVPVGSASGTPYQASLPSNVPPVLTTTAALPVIAATWGAPATTTTYTSYTYIFSYTPAIQAPLPLAPPLSTPTVIAELNPLGSTDMAMNLPMNLRATSTQK